MSNSIESIVTGLSRRRALRIGGSIAAAGALGATPALADHNDNSRRHEAEPVDLEPGDDVERTSDPSQSNFEEEFTFWRVDHGVEFTESEYPEPARTGPDVFHLGASSTGSFWFGVSAPDQNGIQHEINHTGQVAFYMLEAGTDEWTSLKAQFTGTGDLLHVNGVAPQ